MATRKQIEVYNEVCGLLDAATAKLQPIISNKHAEATRNYLMSIWRGIGVERRQLFEVERATHELVAASFKGAAHDRECLAAPGEGGPAPAPPSICNESDPLSPGHRAPAPTAATATISSAAPPSRPPPSTDRTPSAVCSTTTFAAATPMP